MKLVANLSNLVGPSGVGDQLPHTGWPSTGWGPAPHPERGNVMPLIAIVVAALAIGFEQLIQWKYGPMGIVAFVLLTVGIKAKSTKISGVGAVILVLLLAQSG